MAENIISAIIKELILAFGKAIIYAIFIAIAVAASLVICLIGVILSFIKSRILGAINLALLAISVIFLFYGEFIPIIVLAAYFIIAEVIALGLKIFKKKKKI